MLVLKAAVDIIWYMYHALMHDTFLLWVVQSHINRSGINRGQIKLVFRSIWKVVVTFRTMFKKGVLTSLPHWKNAREDITTIPVRGYASDIKTIFLTKLV